MDTQNPLNNDPNNPMNESDTQQTPVGLMGMAPTHDSASVGGKSKTAATVMTFAVILVVGGGTLLYMRSAGSLKDQVDAKQTAAEKKIDHALKNIGAAGNTTADVKALFEETEELISLFAEDPAANQVALNELKKNPFALKVTEEEKVEIVELDRNAALLEAKRAKEIRQQALDSELEKLQLQSTVSGSNPAAFISNRIVRPGDRVGSFKVEAITTDSVLLAVEGSTYTLTMDGPGQFKR